MRKAASRLTVFGVVQSVGFRPCVYRLARRLGLGIAASRMAALA